MLKQTVAAFGAGRCMWESDSGGPLCERVRRADPRYDMSRECATVPCLRARRDTLSLRPTNAPHKLIYWVPLNVRATVINRRPRNILNFPKHPQTPTHVVWTGLNYPRTNQNED